MMIRPVPTAFLVVGGGIGGLATALALARDGHPVRVLERAAEFAEVGAGLQVGPNAARLLDHLGVLDAVTATAFFPRRLVLRDALSGDRITCLDTGEAFRSRFGHRYFVAHRADLHRAVLEACRRAGVELLPDREVVEIAEPSAESGQILVRCADGSSHRADALIGADGLHSPTRSLLVEDGPPVDSGYVTYRGTVSMEAIAEGGGLREPDGMVIWCGPGLHLVQYPVRLGTVCNQVATFDTRRYGGATGDLEAQLSAAFTGTCTDVRAGIALMDTSRRWPMLDRAPASGWSRGPLTLVGDAAHPMLQYLAQGACQAIEDAVALAAAVRDHPGAPHTAFRRYEAARFPRTSRIQATARKWGEVLHVDGIGRDLRAALLRDRATDDYEAVDWLYGAAPDRSTGAAA
jgi:3-hydroxybenzoate 6-monooxygenase